MRVQTGVCCLGVLALVACGGNYDGDDGYGTDTQAYAGESDAGDFDDVTDTEDDAPADTDAPAEEPPEDNDQEAGSGVPDLTAGTWDDNLNIDLFLDYASDVVLSSLSGLPGFSEQERVDANAEHSATLVEHETLDIAVIMDTTGSMNDELIYLRSEFEDLAAQITLEHPDADQRWSLVRYKDEDSSYVTETFDFTGDLIAFQALLNGTTAGGGGDRPEAAAEAMQEATTLDWRGSSTAKLAFWIADAPHHDDKAGDIALAIRQLAADDVHIYPVAASGSADLLEYTMRSAAQFSHGRYLWLTDDSGIGNGHGDPAIPCFFVTTLKDAVLRMVDIEMTGVYREPTPEEIIRTGGDPTDGACTLSEGGEAQVF